MKINKFQTYELELFDDLTLEVKTFLGSRTCNVYLGGEEIDCFTLGGYAMDGFDDFTIVEWMRSWCEENGYSDLVTSTETERYGNY